MLDSSAGPACGAIPAEAGTAAAVEVLLGRVPLIIWATDDQLRLRWVRGGAVRMLGLDQLFGIGTTLETIFGTPDHPIVERHRAALAGHACSLDIDWMDRSYEIWIEPVLDGSAITGCMAVAVDVTEAKRSERTLFWQSGFDELTGALNRSRLCDQMTLLLGAARRRGDELSVLCVDIDGFGSINDSCGTPFADAVLRSVYERIAAVVPEFSVVGRVGADEFAIVFEGTPADVDSLCTSIHRELADPLTVGGRLLYVGVSIGTASFPRDGGSVERLLNCAAAAARHASGLGGRRSHGFSTELTIGSRERMQIENDLRTALQRGELFLVYQPQVRIDDGSIAGVEVLLRWRRDGSVMPAWTFIRQAEESSVIVPIGEWVIDTAFAQLKEWRDRGLDPQRLAINIGARQLADDSIVSTIESALRKYRIPASAVDFEITETAAMQNVVTTARLLEDLRSLGVEISLDDFGTGYSSLSYLRRFAVTGLKIDRSFVADLSESEMAAGIVKAIIATAGVLGMRLVAEGVENEKQAALLRANGCAEAQGFLYSVPLEASAMTAYLEAQAERPRQNGGR